MPTSSQNSDRVIAMPKPKPMTAAEAREAKHRMVDRLVAEGYQPKPSRPARAPKPSAKRGDVR